MIEFILPLLWLIITSYALGFALTRESNLMTCAFGLSVFAVLSIIFNLVGIPLNWLLFLALALCLLAWFIYKNELKLDIPKKLSLPDTALILVLLMALINIYVYYVGASSYPWLEDNDPWVHSVGTTWVAQTGSFSRFFDGTNYYRLYIEPYPPVFDVLMGVLHQMTVSVTDTLKFFNAFLVGAALVCAFFWIEAMTKDRRLAVFAAFFLLALPAFMGHFVWGQTLSMLCLFTAFYGYEKALEKTDVEGKDGTNGLLSGINRYVIASGISIAAVALTEPFVAGIFVVMSVFYVGYKYLQYGKAALKPLITAGLIGILLASLYYVPTVMKYGVKDTADGIGFYNTLFTPGDTGDTSGGVVYSASDFLVVQSEGKIDQQIGIGEVLVLLAIVGLGLVINDLRLGKIKKSDSWMILGAVLLVFGFLGVEGNVMPIKLFPHRFWVFLAIPVAVLGALAYRRIEDRWASYRKALLALLLISVFITSAAGKISVQTSQWPPGTNFNSQDEMNGYVSMEQTLPANTKVFPLCSSDAKIIGMDMMCEPYVPAYQNFKNQSMNKTPSEVRSFMVSRGYDYLVMDGDCVAALGANGTNELVGSYVSSGLFDTAFSNNGMLLLKIKQ